VEGCADSSQALGHTRSAFVVKRLVGHTGLQQGARCSGEVLGRRGSGLPPNPSEKENMPRAQGRPRSRCGHPMPSAPCGPPCGRELLYELVSVVPRTRRGCDHPGPQTAKDRVANRRQHGGSGSARAKVQRRHVNDRFGQWPPSPLSSMDALLDWEEARFRQWAAAPRMASRTVGACLPAPGHPLAAIVPMKVPLSTVYVALWLQ
jgi:hypothetical protein